MHGNNFERLDHGREMAWWLAKEPVPCKKVTVISLPGGPIAGLFRQNPFGAAFRLPLTTGLPKGRSMSFSAVLKSIGFLAILFVMLYVGMNNPKPIEFNFPIGTTAKDPIRAQAGLIYFGIFAVGVLAGTMLHTGGGKKKSNAGREK